MSINGVKERPPVSAMPAGAAIGRGCETAGTTGKTGRGNGRKRGGKKWENALTPQAATCRGREGVSAGLLSLIRLISACHPDSRYRTRRLNDVSARPGQPDRRSMTSLPGTPAGYIAQSGKYLRSVVSGTMLTLVYSRFPPDFPPFTVDKNSISELVKHVNTAKISDPLIH